MWYPCENRYGLSRIKTGTATDRTWLYQELFSFGNTVGKITLAMKIFYHVYENSAPKVIFRVT